MDTQYDTYMQSSSAAASDATVAAVVGGFFLFFIIFAIASYALTAWPLGRIFKKAGIEQWVAWVPIYNFWKLLEMGGQSGYWALLGLIPFVGIISVILLYIAMYKVGQNFGKEGWFVLLAIFLPIIWLFWLAFDDSKWKPKKSDPVAATTKL